MMLPPPAAPHVRPRRARADERRPHVDRDVLVVLLDRQLAERLRHVDRRHVDEDVEPAQRRGAFVDERLAVGGLRQVRLLDEYAAPQRL